MSVYFRISLFHCDIFPSQHVKVLNHQITAESTFLKEWNIATCRAVQFCTQYTFISLFPFILVWQNCFRSDYCVILLVLIVLNKIYLSDGKWLHLVFSYYIYQRGQVPLWTSVSQVSSSFILLIFDMYTLNLQKHYNSGLSEVIKIS